MAIDPDLLIDDDEIHHMRRVLDRATDNYAMLLASNDLDLDADVCELWVDRFYNQLRAALTPEQRLRAIALLLESSALGRASRVLRSVEVD